ncbi:MAG: helix-turn-helix domain-containing protein [Clostridia bacterium]|nr:helix-turn-helix domain-containing protein [Clostridia bacterium]
MNNITLGRVLKAMYKLSGKTLTQLSDETGLTVDTINNLMYARIQKPGLAGVNALVNAMGFKIQQLMAFLEEHPDIPEDSDTVELFTKYIASADDTNKYAAPAKETVRAAKGSFPAEIEMLNEEHEKQLDRFRAANQRHMEQLQAQHNSQLTEMQEHNKQMEQHFGKSIEALKETHAQEIRRLEKEGSRHRKTITFLTVALSVETAVILLMIIVDLINRNIGWFR